jgi:hypothetical protein
VPGTRSAILLHQKISWKINRTEIIQQGWRGNLRATTCNEPPGAGLAPKTG